MCSTKRTGKPISHPAAKVFFFNQIISPDHVFLSAQLAKPTKNFELQDKLMLHQNSHLRKSIENNDK
jgi:hypothetical protein